MNKNFPIKITINALNHFKKYLKKINKNAIEISILKKGCSGLQYNISATDYIKKYENYIEVKIKNILFLIDNNTSKYLTGLKIDYLKQEDGLHKLIYTNPNEIAKCGCGISFYSDK